MGSARQNLNYEIYKKLYATRNLFMRYIPAVLVPKNHELTQRLQIGVTTYIDRYDDFFKPLYLKLISIFPDIDIRVAVNGFYDEDEQASYLKRIEDELCVGLSERITFVMHHKAVGLTTLWNEILGQNNRPQSLILNDDLEIYPWFRHWLENVYWESDYITLIEATWSHFFISRKALEEVGWFDEEFLGIGFEDMDYTARCLNRGIGIKVVNCPYIRHRDHKPTRTSFQTDTIWDKYTTTNKDHFFKKWKACSHDSGIYIKQIHSFVEPTGYIGSIWPTRHMNIINGRYYADKK
jgi:hypothetical protein